MTEIIKIHGNTELKGNYRVDGAKNAVLPILVSSILTPEPLTFYNVPNISDVGYTLSLLKHLGADCSFNSGCVNISMRKLISTKTDYDLVRAYRASFLILGPLLVRGREASIPLPGGDRIGARPVDFHLQALTKMGASINIEHGVVKATAKYGLKPAEIDFAFPSVGATEHILLTAAAIKGTTVINNAAREPEIVELCELLNLMGAQISGAGRSSIVIDGNPDLKGVEHKLIGDRIEAATAVLSAITTKGDINVSGFNPKHFGQFLDILFELGLDLEVGENNLHVKYTDNLKSISVETGPFPKFATDIQPLLMSALTTVPGTSTIVEKIFEGRFGHVQEFCRMGADIKVKGSNALITGVDKLSGAEVDGLDIRSAAAIAIAAFGASGNTYLNDTNHLRRGYSSFEYKYRNLGAVMDNYIVQPRYEDVLKSINS